MNEPTLISSKRAQDGTNCCQRVLPLPLTVRDDPTELTALWAMTKQQRIDAMWACELTLTQLCEWSSRRPSEVPRLGREFAWLVMHTPEWAETREQSATVMPLPAQAPAASAAKKRAA